MRIKKFFENSNIQDHIYGLDEYLYGIVLIISDRNENDVSKSLMLFYDTLEIIRSLSKITNLNYKLDMSLIYNPIGPIITRRSENYEDIEEWG